MKCYKQQTLLFIDKLLIQNSQSIPPLPHLSLGNHKHAMFESISVL